MSNHHRQRNGEERHLRESLESDADGQSPLQLRKQIRRLRLMKRAFSRSGDEGDRARGEERKGTGCDEENEVRVDVSVLGVDGGAFDERQEVALHSFRRGVRAAVVAAAHELVDLVDEHDTTLLHRCDGLLGDVVVLHHLLRLVR